jgi:hypothetical protein
MARKVNDPYWICIIGEAESPFRGGNPVDVADLTKKQPKDVTELMYMAAKAQVEQCIQAGDTKGAWDAIDSYIEVKRTSEGEYGFPLLGFQRDSHNGGAPFIGAHCFMGAFREAAKALFPNNFHKGKGVKGQTGKPAQRMLRRMVVIKPYHVFFHRPVIEKNFKNRINKPDFIYDQQPSESVKAFTRHETIDTPFEFAVRYEIDPPGQFQEILKDPDNVERIIRRSVNHGLGASRGMGYGQWKIVKYQRKDGVPA